MATKHEAHKRIIGADREKFTKQVVTLYGKGQSIREIAAQTGRSYGNIHRLLAEAGVTFRSRGGDTKRAKRPSKVLVR